jgi:plant G-box-binding factor
MQAHTPLSAETPTKSSGNTDQGLMKKLKGFDGLAMSIGNGDAESAEGGSRLPQRFETGTDSPPLQIFFQVLFQLSLA